MHLSDDIASRAVIIPSQMTYQLPAVQGRDCGNRQAPYLSELDFSFQFEISSLITGFFSQFETNCIFNQFKLIFFSSFMARVKYFD